MSQQDIQAAFEQFLKTDTTVAALIGARLYRLRRPQGGTLPAVVYTPADEVEHHQGGEALHQLVVRIDCWGSTPAQARQVRDAVAARLAPFAAGGGWMSKRWVKAAFPETSLPDFPPSVDGGEEQDPRETITFRINYS